MPTLAYLFELVYFTGWVLRTLLLLLYAHFLTHVHAHLLPFTYYLHPSGFIECWPLLTHL